MARGLNVFINLLKWPIGSLMLLLLLPGLQQLWQVIFHIYLRNDAYQPLFIGVVLYGVFWWLWFRNSVMGQWFRTLEHELTHALFAVLSLNRVTGLNVTGHAGGVMRYEGYGNWVITLAPYFVPTLSLLVLAMLLLAQKAYYPYLLAALGFTLAHHMQSTWHEINARQTDLKQAGWVFCWVFLPGANVLVMLWVLVMIPGDRLSWAHTWQLLEQPLEMVLNVLHGLL